MSARTNVYLSVGLMILMLLTIGVGGYFIKRANDAVDETKRLILEGREIGNKRGNQTLGAVGEAIQEIKVIEGELRDNLTAHRIVANNTNERVFELQNQTNSLISNFNETNEVERTKAVQRIIDGINNNTKLLEQLLDQKNLEYQPSGGIASIK